MQGWVKRIGRFSLISHNVEECHWMRAKSEPPNPFISALGRAEFLNNYQENPSRLSLKQTVFHLVNFRSNFHDRLVTSPWPYFLISLLNVNLDRKFSSLLYFGKSHTGIHFFSPSTIVYMSGLIHVNG